MQGSKRYGLWFIAGLLALLGSWDWWASHEPTTHLGDASTTASSASTEADVKPLDVSSGQSGDGQVRFGRGRRNAESNEYSEIAITSRFLNARSAVEASAAIDQASVSGNDRLTFNLYFYLRGRCDFAVEDQPPYERTRWAFDLLRDYCEGYLPSDDLGSLLLGPATSELSTQSITELVKKFQDLEYAEFESYYMEKMLNVSNVQEFEALEQMAEHLLRTGVPLAFGIESDQHISAQSQKNIQHAVFTLYSCSLFGGCQANDLNTLVNCIMTGSCEKGWSLYDYFVYTLSTLEWERVNGILQYVQSYRVDHQ